MMVVKVICKVKSEFAQKNQKNTCAFMEDFRKLGSTDFRNSPYVRDDGKTFVHLSLYKNENIQKKDVGRGIVQGLPTATG